MRTVLFVNNRVGAEVAALLATRPGPLVAAVLHPEATRSYGARILDAISPAAPTIIDARDVNTTEARKALRALEPDVGVSAYFGHILDASVLELFPEGVVNLHPGFLPYNRGAFTNVWPIIDRTPAGVTLHQMDAGVDTGGIIAQERVQVEPTDTGETLYRRLEDTAIELFERAWPEVEKGGVHAEPQDTTRGTYHARADVQEIDEISLDDKIRARDLINILRARTFPPHRGAYFEIDGRRIQVRVSLEEIDREDGGAEADPR